MFSLLLSVGLWPKVPVVAAPWHCKPVFAPTRMDNHLQNRSDTVVRTHMRAINILFGRWQIPLANTVGVGVGVGIGCVNSPHPSRGNNEKVADLYKVTYHNTKQIA